MFHWLSRGILILGAGAIALVISAAAPQAQVILDDTKVKDISREVDALIADMQTRAEGYPDIIAELREKSAKIEKAGETIDQMIADLTEMTDKMDTESEFRAEMMRFDGQMLDLISTVEASADQELMQYLPGLQERYDRLQTIDQNRAKAVIEARATIRDLRDNRDRIILLYQMGQIDAALDAMDKSVIDFVDIVQRAGQLTDDLIGSASP